MSNLLKLKQIDAGGGTNKFVTVDGTGKIIAALDFIAGVVPFNPGVTAMVSTDVNAAIIEVWNLALASTFTNPMTTDLQFANGFGVKAVNGLGALTLRKAANNEVELTNGTNVLQLFPTGWGITSNVAFNAASSYVQYDNVGDILTINTNNNLAINIGTNMSFNIDASTGEIDIKGLFNGVVDNFLYANDNFAAGYMTPNIDSAVVIVGSKRIAVSAGVKNSVALGGSNYTVNVDNTTYVKSLGLANTGLFTHYFTSAATAVRNIVVPDASGNLAITSNTSDYLGRFTSLNKFENSLIQDNGVGLAVNAVLDATTMFTITAGLSQLSAINVLQTNIGGGSIQSGIIATSNGNSNQNAAIRLDAQNASTDNFAIYIDNGDIYGLNTGLVLGGGITPDHTLYTAQITAFSTAPLAVQIINSNTTGTQRALQLVVNGAAPTNIGNTINISNGTTNNVGSTYSVAGGLISKGIDITVSGGANDNIGIQINSTETAIWAQTGALLVGTATGSPTNASVIAEFTSANQAVLIPRVTDPTSDIATPVAGMIAFSIGANRFEGYNGTAWVVLG